jgi:4-carboxymuconolactone decarboxylase
LVVTAAALDPAGHALVALGAAIAVGDAPAIEAGALAARQAGVPARAIDELVLQSVLTVGWPRALVAAGACRSALGTGADDRSGDLDYGRHADWTARGEATCRIIYGDHYDKLRTNVRQLHPALEAWMITEGYGRTLSRPGLDLKSRELCTVAQTAVLRTPRQLHSHLLGALRAGASAAEITATLNATRPLLSASEWDEVVVLWNRVRDAQAGVP